MLGWYRRRGSEIKDQKLSGDQRSSQDQGSLIPRMTPHVARLVEADELTRLFRDAEERTPLLLRVAPAQAAKKVFFSLFFLRKTFVKSRLVQFFSIELCSAGFLRDSILLRQKRFFAGQLQAVSVPGRAAREGPDSWCR